MHDHRVPRHDRPPETWLPHPGTPDAAPLAPMPLLKDTAPLEGAPMWPANASLSLRGLLLRPDASLFARVVLGMVQGKKNIPVAIGFALLGPLGLFYVSFLNGVAALVVIPFVVRGVAVEIAQAIGGSPATVLTLAVILCWCITIPWSSVAARRRNIRLGLG